MNDTFGKVISTLESDPNCKFVDGTDKSEIISNLKELCDISWRTHHASVDELEEKSEIPITKSELMNKYIPLTLDLLFGKL